MDTEWDAVAATMPEGLVEALGEIRFSEVVDALVAHQRSEAKTFVMVGDVAVFNDGSYARRTPRGSEGGLFD